MKVQIDASKCQGHGRCCSLAADLFDFDDSGRSIVIGDGAVRPDQVGLARTVVSNCPESAIALTAESSEATPGGCT